MTLQIALTLGVVVLVLIAFIREWAPLEVIALSTLCLVTALGLIPMNQMANVFRNEAPLTIAALFVIGAALEVTGAVEKVGEFIQKNLRGGLRSSILGISLLTATTSAFMNNTAIVAILMPVIISFARTRNHAAGRLLMPLSYASLFGGCCTLIGTSTNLLANGVFIDMGQTPMGMFELAPIGIPIAAVGIIYLTIFGPKLIPARASVTSALDTSFRTKPLHHYMVREDSPLINMPWMESPLAATDAGVHTLEIRRGSKRFTEGLNQLVIQKFDRFLITFHGKKSADSSDFENALGLEQLSETDGIITELVIDKDSRITGRTMQQINFRQHYNAVVLAVHRNGRNVTRKLASLRLSAGDTLLVVTPSANLGDLEKSRDFVLTDAPVNKTPLKKGPALLATAALAGTVIVTALSDLLHNITPAIPSIPIHFAALVAMLTLLWARILTPRQAYRAIDWQVLFMLYGLLGLGMTMQATGTADYLANSLITGISSFIGPALLPYVLLWSLYLLTLMLTEVISNNATVLMMLPIAMPLAAQAGVSSRPFAIGVILASSLAFAMPMGYQTHLMIYGPGGFRFSDFLRAGLPLNILCWITACTLIPLIWPFY